MPKTYTELTLKDLVALAEVKLRKSPTTSASFPKCLHVCSPRITLLHLLPLAPPSRNPAITQERQIFAKQLEEDCLTPVSLQTNCAPKDHSSSTAGILLVSFRWDAVSLNPTAIQQLHKAASEEARERGTPPTSQRASGDEGGSRAPRCPGRRGAEALTGERCRRAPRPAAQRRRAARSVTSPGPSGHRPAWQPAAGPRAAGIAGSGRPGEASAAPARPRDSPARTGESDAHREKGDPGAPRAPPSPQLRGAREGRARTRKRRGQRKPRRGERGGRGRRGRRGGRPGGGRGGGRRAPWGGGGAPPPPRESLTC